MSSQKTACFLFCDQSLVHSLYTERLHLIYTQQKKHLVIQKNTIDNTIKTLFSWTLQHCLWLVLQKKLVAFGQIYKNGNLIHNTMQVFVQLDLATLFMVSSAEKLVAIGQIYINGNFIHNTM